MNFPYFEENRKDTQLLILKMGYMLQKEERRMGGDNVSQDQTSIICINLKSFWVVFLSEALEDNGRSFTTFVLTGSLAFEVVAVAGRLISCIFSALGFGMVEAEAGRSWGRVAPVVADPSVFLCLASCSF